MADSVITHVRKDTRDNITHVGVKNSWKWSVTDVIASIEKSVNTFYVNCPERTDVYVAKTPAGHKFLKTTADTTTRNNLDDLPSF